MLKKWGGGVIEKGKGVRNIIHKRSGFTLGQLHSLNHLRPITCIVCNFSHLLNKGNYLQHPLCFYAHGNTVTPRNVLFCFVFSLNKAFPPTHTVSPILLGPC